jgi:hypothetical protein
MCPGAGRRTLDVQIGSFPISGAVMSHRRLVVQSIYAESPSLRNPGRRGYIIRTAPVATVDEVVPDCASGALRTGHLMK